MRVGDEAEVEVDRHDVRLATGAPDVLAAFNRAEVFGPAEIHGAVTLARLAGDERPEVLLAAALALRAPQHGHVCVDLADLAASLPSEHEAPAGVETPPWPELGRWRSRLVESPLVRVRPEGTPSREELQPERDRPLVLVGDRLYLDRYWRYERRVAVALVRRAARVDADVELGRVREILDRLLPPGLERPDRQRLAVATAACRDLTVIAGGPGTGKTHTVARLLALLHELAPNRPPRIALAAPTGKAADRLTAALRAALDDPSLEVTRPVRERLRDLEASTVHRLLGWRPGSATRFHHDRNHKLPHQVVVVDETSMVDLPLMAKLVESLRTDTKLVLVGDPDQLASVEAGAVLADVVGPSGDRLRMTETNRQFLEAATGEPLDAGADGGRTAVRIVEPSAGIDDAVVVLRTVRRFAPDSGIDRFAAAVHVGDVEAALGALRSGTGDLTWLEVPGEARDRPELAPVRRQVVAAATVVVAASHEGDAVGALTALDTVRVLTAHRRGLVGVAGWVPLVERWLAAEIDGYGSSGREEVGRPVMITRNEPRLRLFNGDVGVTVRRGDSVQVAFPTGAGIRTFAPNRLEDTETVHAMTIHKSQGSQFENVIVVLPTEGSQLLTRELLYTAVTRARRGVTLVATEEVLRHTLRRHVSRASGLRSTIWPVVP